MSVDVLQEKIRKRKNPSVVEFAMDRSLIPPHILQCTQSMPAAYRLFCEELLAALKDTVGAVRFSMSGFALHGPEGMEVLQSLLGRAKELGYYVILDAPEILSPNAAQAVADTWQDGMCCDAMVVSPWIGSDALRPFVPLCRQGRAVFCPVRNANKSAAELQDLLTGSRLVHSAAAGMVNRHGETILGKYGYSQLGALVGATAPDSIRSLKAKYSTLFFLVDGYDYPGANAKNCSYAFDKLGYGAAVCGGSSITAAWKEENDGEHYTDHAVQAAQRMKRNLGRYITVL